MKDSIEKCLLDRVEIRNLVYEAISYNQLQNCLQNGIIQGTTRQLDTIADCIIEAQYSETEQIINGKYVLPDDIANILFQTRWFHAAFILSKLSSGPRAISMEELTYLLYITVAMPSSAYKYRVSFQRRHWDIRFD